MGKDVVVDGVDLIIEEAHKKGETDFKKREELHIGKERQERKEKETKEKQKGKGEGGHPTTLIRSCKPKQTLAWDQLDDSPKEGKESWMGSDL